MSTFFLSLFLLIFLGCFASNEESNLHSFDEENDLEGFDEPDNFKQSETSNINENEYDEQEDLSEDFGEEFEDSRDEIEVVSRHVSFQDAAREALLKLAVEFRKGKNVTNAFLKVIDAFEKGIAEFQAALGRRRVTDEMIKKVRDFIQEAAKNRTKNTLIIRDFTAQGLYLAEKLPGKSAAGKRSTDFLAKGAAAFLNSIKDHIGEGAFEEYLSISGLVTLMFAIDDTGSMSGDIRSAIQISKQIVNSPRDYDVDYILSPFNDPTTGPITTKSETQGAEFVKALEALRANGGGDCPELAFKGMIDALESGPQPGSSMYVFTDASPKDATSKNKDKVLERAHDLDVKINFFTRGDCGKPKDFEHYKDVATETGGLIYPLRSSFELKQLGKLVASSLQGAVALSSGGSGAGASGRRRRAADREYSISIDDSVQKLTITVTTTNSAASVKLVDPKGKTVIAGRVLLSKGVLYSIDSPLAEVYKLTVPASAGAHSYRVAAASDVNIDFGHFYVLVANRGSRVPIPLSQPLQGFTAKALVTIAGAEFVKSSSLRIKAVNEEGVQVDVALNSVGITGVRYLVTFEPPAGAYKLQLHGETRKGFPFVRVSTREDQVVPVILKLSYKADSNTLPRGRETKIRLRILRGNVGVKRQKYTLSVKDERGYAEVQRQPTPVVRARTGFAQIVLSVPESAPVGKTDKVELFLTRVGESLPIASLSFQLLIVRI